MIPVQLSPKSQCHVIATAGSIRVIRRNHRTKLAAHQTQDIWRTRLQSRSCPAPFLSGLAVISAFSTPQSITHINIVHFLIKL